MCRKSSSKFGYYKKIWDGLVLFVTHRFIFIWPSRLANIVGSFFYSIIFADSRVVCIWRKYLSTFYEDRYTVWCAYVAVEAYNGWSNTIFLFPGIITLSGSSMETEVAVAAGGWTISTSIIHAPIYLIFLLPGQPLFQRNEILFHDKENQMALNRFFHEHIFATFLVKTNNVPCLMDWFFW